MKRVRTRYAPSPTGFLHVGGARTALYCYLYAKHFNGDFIFRLEDTDIKRNVKHGEKSQLVNLEWLGITPDESPIIPDPKIKNYRQSEKIPRYWAVANELIEKGFAYEAYDTTEELQKQKQEAISRGVKSFRYDKNWLKISEEEKQIRKTNKQYSIRLKMPKDLYYSWNDLVRGEISFSSNEIGDWVIFKSDGYPTYNFAVVIDDFDMRISHVLRGEEHIGNTPKQLAIYKYLNWEIPQFGHLTIITNMEGQKLSKRNTELKQFIEDYRTEGYHPHAVFNFLSLLGWSSSDAKEKMTKEELIQRFDPSRLSKSPSKFDIQKMNWFSKQYIKQMDAKDILEKLNIDKKKYETEWLNLFIDTFKESSYTFLQISNQLKLYDNPIQETEILIQGKDIEVVKCFTKLLLENKEFNVSNIQKSIDNTQKELNVKGKKLFMPIRLATTYLDHGPELAKAIYLFGQQTIIERLKKWN